MEYGNVEAAHIPMRGCLAWQGILTTMTGLKSDLYDDCDVADDVSVKAAARQHAHTRDRTLGRVVPTCNPAMRHPTMHHFKDATTRCTNARTQQHDVAMQRRAARWGGYGVMSP